MTAATDKKVLNITPDSPKTDSKKRTPVKANAKTNSKKVAATKKTASTEEKGTEVTTPKKTNAKSNGKNYQLRDVKLADMTTVDLTQEAFDALDAVGIIEAILTDGHNRLSRERAKAELVGRIREGKIKNVSASALMDWTYKAVKVAGVTIKNPGFSDDNTKVNLTQEEFDALDNVAIAGHIDKFTQKRRIADDILLELIKAGMPLTAKDVVYLTNGRVAIEGVAVESASKKSSANVEGVTFD